MAGTAHILVALFFCGMGLSVSGAWFVLRGRGPVPAWPDMVDTPEGVRRRGRRRTLGMAIVALLSTATGLGLVIVDPLRTPVLFGLYWLAVLMLVAWLGGVAVVDVFHTLSVQRRWMQTRSRAAVEEYLRCLRSRTPPDDPA